MVRYLMVAVLVASAATGCSADTEAESSTTEAIAPNTTTTLAATTSALSTTTTTIEAPGATGGYLPAAPGTLQSVSPDARLLLLTEGGSVCLRPVDRPESECVEWREGDAPALLNTGWSRDGVRVAFSDRVETSREFMGPVWLLEEGSLFQLLEAEGTLSFGLALHDETLAFLGALGEGDLALSLVDQAGQAAPLADIGAGPIEWLPDGSGLIYTGLQQEDRGLWFIDADDGSLRLVVEPDQILGPPFLTAVSSDGAWALIYYRNFVAAEFFPPGTSHYGLVNLVTGEVSPLMERPDGDFAGPAVAAFSSDARSIAYVYHAGVDRKAPMVLAVRSTSGGDERIISSDLLADVGPPPTPDIFSLQARWGSNGLLVFPTAQWALVIELE